METLYFYSKLKREVAFYIHHIDPTPLKISSLLNDTGITGSELLVLIYSSLPPSSPKLFVHFLLILKGQEPK